jgi:hypothetical protein
LEDVLAPDIFAAITNGEVRIEKLTIAHPLGFFIGHLRCLNERSDTLFV